MPLFLGRQCWYFFDDKTPFPGAKAILSMLYVYVLACFFETLKKCIPDLFSILYSDKI